MKPYSVQWEIESAPDTTGLNSQPASWQVNGPNPSPDCINNMDNKRYALFSIDFGTLCIQISIDISKEQYFAKHKVSKLLLFGDVRAYLN